MRTSVRLALLALAALLAPGAGAARQATGPLIAISTTTGTLQPFPRVSGSAVYAIADDGAGGWFVGGEFSSVGGVACRNLVHVSSNGTVDRSWCPRPDGIVRALARVEGVLYVGAEGMHRIAGVARTGLAALDVDSGRARAWNPGTPGRTFGVYNLAPGHGVIYATGEFLSVGGKARQRMAAISLANGRATRFAPNPDEDTHGDSAVAAVVAAGSVYVWGFFSRIGGLARDSFARLDPITGHALETVVSPICPTALLARGAELYAGTDASCQGVKRPLIALSLPRLEPLPLPPTIPRRYVEALGASPQLLVAAAANLHFSGTEPRVLVGIGGTGRRAFTSPVHPIGAVEAVQVSATLVLVGGLFRSVG